MNHETLAAIREHALAEYPREACGLTVVVKGRERYIPCRNTAQTASEHFQLAAQDYATAEDMGEVTAIVHSHPDELARASEADKVACEASGLPWLIVSVLKEDGVPVASEVNQIEPCGYEAPLIGRTFAHGVTDCFSLIVDYYKRELGIQLPNFERHDNWWNDGHSDLYTEGFEKAGFVQVDGPPRKHDVLLMQIRSNNRVPNHAAIYLGDGQMMHHLYGRLSSRDTYMGQWIEYTRMIVRHRSMLAPSN